MSVTDVSFVVDTVKIDDATLLKRKRLFHNETEETFSQKILEEKNNTSSGVVDKKRRLYDSNHTNAYLVQTQQFINKSNSLTVEEDLPFYTSQWSSNNDQLVITMMNMPHYKYTCSCVSYADIYHAQIECINNISYDITAHRQYGYQNFKIIKIPLIKVCSSINVLQNDRMSIFIINFL